MVCGGLTCLLFLKGIPVGPVLLILGVFIVSAWFALKSKTTEQQQESEENLYEKIRVHPIEIHVNKELYGQLMSHEESLFHSISRLRERIAFDLGFVLPEVKIKFCFT